jgi:hypothetical protein
MNFSVSIEYSWWFIAFCLVAGGLYSFVLYRKEKRFSESPVWVRYSLPTFRFLSVAALSFFLLSPFVNSLFRTVEKPIIIFAQDNSESIAAGKDSAYYKKEYANQVKQLLAQLSQYFDIHEYSFGGAIRNDLSFSYREKQTDLSALFDEIDTRFSNRNVGAVLLASDGLYNKGRNPLYSIKNNFPVYTIALGDTTTHKDVAAGNILFNKIVYLGNTFPLLIQLEAHRLKGKTFTCTVSKDNEKLFTQQITISSNDFYVDVQALLAAKQKGIQRYTISLSHIEGEITYLNNTKDIFVEVVDGRQKILILAHAPHPDVAAIKNALEGNQNYEVTVSLAADFKSSSSAYSVVVLHQLPSSNYPLSSLLLEMDKQKTPALFILGSQTSLPFINHSQSDLTITSFNGSTSDVTPIVANDFSSFTLSNELKSFVAKLPPLQCPFGTYQHKTAAAVLCYQRIGVVATQQPLISFVQQGEKKKGFICGEGIWRWRLQNAFEHTNVYLFNELFTKTIQYLAAVEDKSLFRVNGKNNFDENQPVELNAELYNDSYEFINEPDVNLELLNQEGKKFLYAFSKTTNGYHLNAGVLPVGHYRYEAKTTVGAKNYSVKGELSVSALQAESSATVADHQLLYSLAKKSGGEPVQKNQLTMLAEILSKREDIHSVSHSEKQLLEMINLKWIFFVILSLISFEWLIRKMNGGI